MSDIETLKGQVEVLMAAARESGAALTVAEFARRAKINRSTLYSSFPDIVKLINEARPHVHQGRKGRPRDEVLASLKSELLVAHRERRAAREEREVYALQIRVLSLQLAEALEELRALTGVSVIKRASQDNGT